MPKKPPSRTPAAREQDDALSAEGFIGRAALAIRDLEVRMSGLDRTSIEYGQLLLSYLDLRAKLERAEARVAQIRREQSERSRAERTGGAKGGKTPKRNAASSWQTDELKRLVEVYLPSEGDSEIARRLAKTIPKGAETLREYVRGVRQASGVRKVRK